MELPPDAVFFVTINNFLYFHQYVGINFTYGCYNLSSTINSQRSSKGSGKSLHSPLNEPFNHWNDYEAGKKKRHKMLPGIPLRCTAASGREREIAEMCNSVESGLFKITSMPSICMKWMILEFNIYLIMIMWDLLHLAVEPIWKKMHNIKKNTMLTHVVSYP